MLTDTDLFAGRIAKLERENRLLKIGGIVLALGQTGLVSIGAIKSPRTIEAEKIVLLDQHGHARITMGTPAYAGAAIDVSPDDPAIWISDDKGADRAILTADGLYFANANSKPVDRYN